MPRTTIKTDTTHIRVHQKDLGRVNRIRLQKGLKQADLVSLLLDVYEQVNEMEVAA